MNNKYKLMVNIWKGTCNKRIPLLYSENAKQNLSKNLIKDGIKHLKEIKYRLNRQ